MSEFYHSPLERVDRIEKLRWLDDPVTQALLATLKGFGEASARQIVTSVRGNFEVERSILINLAASISVCETLTDHIKHVEKPHVIA